MTTDNTGSVVCCRIYTVFPFDLSSSGTYNRMRCFPFFYLFLWGGFIARLGASAKDKVTWFIGF